MINKPFVHLLPPFIRKFGMIPSSYLIAMTYEEQLLWLCKYCEDLGLEIENIKTALSNIEGEIANIYTTIEGIENNISELSRQISNKQDKLVAGANIYLFNNDIQAHLNLPYSITSEAYIDVSGDIGSVVDLTPILQENTAYFIKDIKENDFFLLKGTFTLVKLDENNEIVFKYEEPVASSTFSYYEALSDGKLVVSWTNINEFEPYIAQSASAKYLIKNIEGIPEWVNNEENQTSFVTEVTSESSNDEVPSALAVYNAIMEAIGGGTVISYNDLSNLPSINGTTIEGSLTTSDLKINDIPILSDDTYNIWNLDNGIYYVDNSIGITTTIMCGNETIPLGIADDSCLLIVYGATNGIIPKAGMVMRMSSDGYRPSFEIYYCTDINTGYLVQANANAIGYNVNRVNNMGDSTTSVPTEHSVKVYVDTQVGNIETILNTLNVGSGVV